MVNFGVGSRTSNILTKPSFAAVRNEFGSSSLEVMLLIDPPCPRWRIVILAPSRKSRASTVD